MPRLNINISYWTIGCITGASAVALGAFGAHGLKKHISDPKALKNWETAAHYQVSPLRRPSPHTELTGLPQLFHALAILVASPANPTAAALFTAGVTMFSGSLYAMVLAGPERLQESGLGKVLGPITPIGGVCLIAGWALMARRGRIAL
jgi:uncharacterized membrane protein YgdD (TMEM256/DUF423 family)